MDVDRLQEFTPRVFLTSSNSSVFVAENRDLSAINTREELISYELDSYKTISLTEQRIKNYQYNLEDKINLWSSQDSNLQPTYTVEKQQNYDITKNSDLDRSNYLGLDNIKVKGDRDILTGNYNHLWQQDNSNFSIKTPEQQSDKLFLQTALTNNKNQSLLKNSDFSQPLNITNWQIGKKGQVKEYDRHVEKVAYIENVPERGRQMYLKLPQEARVNYEDQLALFQDISNLKTDKIYAVEAKVKWLNPENKLPSAIVSFWAKNPDNSFQGQDFVITDGDDYRNISFEFTPSEIGITRFFLGLFTHVEGNIDDTEIYVDDYRVTEIGDVATGLDRRQGNILNDGGFDRYNAESESFDRNGWTHTRESPIPGLTQSVQTVNQNQLLRLEFPKAEHSKDENNTSVTGVYQNVDLVGGQSYRLSADFQRQELDSFGYRDNSLVQFIVYRRKNNGEELFLGPIDIQLTDNESISQSFNIIAPESGQYTILVRLAGWGNEGNGMIVDVDNVSLVAR